MGKWCGRNLTAGALLVLTLALPAFAAPLRTDIFPGQCRPEISDAILRAFDRALARDYAGAQAICEQLVRDYPGHPAGTAGLMVLYQVMMLENDDYYLDAELQRAALANQRAVELFLKEAEPNAWYYTLAGASWGIQGIYYLRRDEYLMGFYRGFNALRYLNRALELDPNDWEARMGLGLFKYYRSAYASFLPFIFPDQRAEGIADVQRAGRERPYLREISQIALYYIYLNQKDYDRALAVQKNLMADRPEFVIYYQFAGRAMMEKHDYRAALPYYQRIREIDPSLYLPLFKMGECHFLLGEYDPARALLEQFLREARHPAPNYTAAARDYLRRIPAKT